MNPYLLFLQFSCSAFKNSNGPFTFSPHRFLVFKVIKFSTCNFFYGINLFKSLLVICVTIACCKGKNTVPLDDSKCGERALRESLNVVKHYKI